MKRFVFGFLILSGLVFLSFACSASSKENLDSLVEKGKVLVQNGTYDAGIAVLETVLAKDPQNAKALSALLSAYEGYVRKLSAAGRLEQAQTMVTKMESTLQKMNSVPDSEFSADELESNSRLRRETAEAKLFLASQNTSTKNAETVVRLNSGRQKFNEAVKHFEKREYELAEELLKESIEVDPKNPYAYELLADIANLNHRLDDAEGYYKQAFSLNPDARIRSKLEKLIREKKLDQTQQLYSDEHFIIRYQRNEKFEGSEIRQFLRDAYRDISQEMGFYPHYKIPVTLYNRTEYETLMGSVPHWSGALYDGKIRLPVYAEGTTSQELKKLIFHELTHAFVLDISKMQCPVWLNEGLAQYQENKIIPIALDALLSQSIRNGIFISPSELLIDAPEGAQDQAMAAVFYLESFSMTSELLARYDWHRMKQLLIELGNGAKFEEAFEKTYARSFSDFGSEWKTAVLKRYGKK